MKIATSIGRLRTAGIAPDHAQAFGEALEQSLGEDYVTKAYLDARLDAKISELKAQLFQAMFLQTAATVGIVVVLIKLLP